MNRTALATVIAVTITAVAAPPSRAQTPLPEPAAPSYSPAELDRIVSPVALYPDPLLAQVLAAATYSTEIPDAARWADSHHSFNGERLADAIYVHPYAVRRYAGPLLEQHHVIPRAESRESAREAHNRRR